MRLCLRWRIKGVVSLSGDLWQIGCLPYHNFCDTYFLLPSMHFHPDDKKVWLPWVDSCKKITVACFFLMDAAYFLLRWAEKCGLISRLKHKEHWFCYSKAIPRKNCLKRQHVRKTVCLLEQWLWLATLLNLLKSSGFCYVPPVLTVKGSTYIVHLCGLYVSQNKQHQLTSFHNRDERRLLHGRV
jgi:hypothetical protein